METNSLLVTSFANIFSHCEGCLFILFIVSFAVWKLLSISENEVKVKVTQSCLTVCNPMDYTVHGILQARILEWVAFPFSRGSSQSRDWTQVSHIAGRFFTSWDRKVPFCLFLFLFPWFWEMGQKRCCYNLHQRAFWLCPPLGVL